MYKIKSGCGNHTRIINGNRVVIRPGKPFNPTKEELKSFGEKFEKIPEKPNTVKNKVFDEKLKLTKPKLKIKEEIKTEKKKEEMPEPKYLGGGWYEVNGRKIQGKKNAYKEWEKSSSL